MTTGTTTSPRGTRDRRAAARLWGRQPAGTERASSARGTADFYEQMRRTRYEVQPWHPRLLANHTGQRLLEIGCGAGTDLSALGSGFGYAVGIDLAPAGAGLAAGALRHWGVTGATLAADGEALPFAPASFDFVYSFGVLHHTDHPEAAVDEIRRVLRPGGRVLIGLYHRWSLFTAYRLARWVLDGAFRTESFHDFLARAEAGLGTDDTRPRVRLYSRASTRRLLAGFSEISTRVEHVGLPMPAVPGLEAAVGRLFGWYVLVEAVR